MATLSPNQADAARKSQSLLLQRLSSVGQVKIAEVLGVSEATVSRMKDGQIESFTALLGALDLKVVPAANRCYPPEHIIHLEYFARIGMQQAPQPLEWNQE